MLSMMLFGLVFGAFMSFIIVGAYVLVASFILWMAVDAAKQDRFWWLVCILGIPIIGAAVYYFTEKKHEYAKIESHHIHTSETEEQHEVTPKKRTRKSQIKEEPQKESVPHVSVTENVEEEKKDENVVHNEAATTEIFPAESTNETSSEEKQA